ncbi:CRTAC1 family protein [Pirellula sp. SH-Sr6A]|uniref:CRTAC1 family protein n=1 Tax=Pirellula sp. SH-Sr6A TaxID=1632865 RepID=UPI00197BA91C|nr:CRTAC1 family protein [Pirellula sp. SH-Sr6A]
MFRFSLPVSISQRFALGSILLGAIIAGCQKRTNDSAQSTALVQRSIALLENGAETDKEGKLLVESLEGFRKIATQFPNDPLGHQNLAVALLARLKLLDESEAPKEFAAFSKELEKTIQKLESLAPDEPDGETLLGRYFQLRGNASGTCDAFQLAIAKKNARPDTFYQLIQHLQTESDGNPVPELPELYESALKLAPTNLVLQIGYLDALVKNQKASAVAHLESVREALQPVMARTNSPIPKLLERATAALAKEDWRTAQTQVTFLRNVLLAELAYQNDLHLLEPHDLEFVVLRLSQTKPPVPAPSTKRNQSFAPKSPLPFPTGVVVHSVAVEDVDLDGKLDLVVVTDNELKVWNPAGDSQGTTLMMAPLRGAADGLRLGDLDHDFQFRKDVLPTSALPTTAPPDAPSNPYAQWVDTDLDVVVYGKEGLQLFRNDLLAEGGKREFVSVPLGDGLEDLRNVSDVHMIDLDHDSDLDLAIASDEGVTLWSNRGDWTFAPFSPYSTLPGAEAGAHTILGMDFDRNVLNDFIVGSIGGKPTLLANNLHGRYIPRSLTWPDLVTNRCTYVEAIDVDSDACWDLVMGGLNGAVLVRMKSLGRHAWTPASAESLSTDSVHGLMTGDWDNDGYQDVVLLSTGGMQFFYGSVDGKLIKSEQVVAPEEPIRQSVAWDLDTDGDDDIVVLSASGQLSYLENKEGNRNRRIEVMIRADEDGKQRPRERCNMHGVGSLIELKSGGSYQSRIVRGTRTTFGLGEAKSADIVRILWTNGIPNNVIGIGEKTTIFDQQNLGGSCPYLYTWNGERFEFCTDCLWAAPIGLQFAQGVAAPTRDWEYLKIDGSLLKPKDGEYILQLTEELWEAAYFDSVQLMAIDHPADVEIYTNEKVGPAELAEFKIHAVRERRVPRTVVDQQGRDWKPTIQKRDGQYTRSWTEGVNQGLVETHSLEMDLHHDDWKGRGLTLYLTGWVFPTSTSLNVGMTENPNKPKLKPPAIEVLNEKGEWVEVIPYAGFPGGKTKTIAIDLSNAFLTDDRRVRLVTNMELCWDEIFFSVADQVGENEHRRTPLPLRSAELHYRGFSALLPQPGNAPKRYAYEEVSTESIWPPMLGRFTRYGEVSELVRDPDDLQVVMGAGDEMTVRFNAPTGDLPEGWVRDFILYNVGWDKDADLNTLHGQSVEPLPFRAMERYPYSPEQSYPDTPRHREFLEKYQTRQQDSRLFWDQIRDSTSAN